MFFLFTVQFHNKNSIEFEFFGGQKLFIFAGHPQQMFVKSLSFLDSVAPEEWFP